MELKHHTNIKMKGRVKAQFHDVKTGFLTKETPWIDNIIVDVGLISIANRLTGANTKVNAGEITYCAVGTGLVGPSTSGTILNNEIERVAISTSSVNIDNVAEIRAFFNASQAIGILTEVGMFGEDATATIDTGTLMQWIALSVSKTASETLTIISQITFTYS